MKAFTLLFIATALSVATHSAYGFFTPKMTTPSSVNVVKTHQNSTLYAVNATGYERPIYLLNLFGDTRYDMGYTYGFMLANESVATWNALMNAELPDKWEQDAIFLFLDSQWEKYLSKQVSSDLLDEIRGVGDGAAAAGQSKVHLYTTRGITLANFPGDIESNIEWLIINELESNGKFQELLDIASSADLTPEALLRNAIQHGKALFNHGCSFYGAWGSRTESGKLYTSRNLDWAANTGIAENKLITVFHPPGKIAHATVGFAGMYGALTGMSAQGISVHEAGDDNKKETFEGFPWTLRLRYLMENTHNLADATQIWQSTNNTLGMNHAIGAAFDKKLLALETKAHYTAYFYDNDPREANYTVDGKKMGAPLPDAVWRTNHGYDPEWLSTATYSAPGQDTLVRYFLIHDTFVQYEQSGSSFIGDLQAVNLTAIAGDKGGSTTPSFVSCDNASKGSNIISVTYVPQDLRLLVAFEETTSEKVHIPAACGYYVGIDLTPYFG